MQLSCTCITDKTTIAQRSSILHALSCIPITSPVELRCFHDYGFVTVLLPYRYVLTLRVCAVKTLKNTSAGQCLLFLNPSGQWRFFGWGSMKLSRPVCPWLVTPSVDVFLAFFWSGRTVVVQSLDLRRFMLSGHSFNKGT